MNIEQQLVLGDTRRHFFKDCAVGVGKIALASLLAEGPARAQGQNPNPLAPKPPHYTPKAKRVIYMFMAGGPSQLELFDHKPTLNRYNDQPIPDSYMKDKRFAF